MAEFWLFHQAFPEAGEAVRLVNEARRAVVEDTAARAQEAGFSPVRVFSPVPFPEGDGVGWVRTDSQQLVGDVAADAAAGMTEAVCYGGGGMAAMTAADWAWVRARLAEGAAAANRVFSCDWVAVPQGRLLRVAAGSAMDNSWARRLRDGGEVELVTAARSARTLLDLDTPTDAAVLAACWRVRSLALGPRVRRALEVWSGLLEPLVARLEGVWAVMTRREGELVLAGRVSGSEWAQVDSETACRWRVLAEERGLRGRAAEGIRARSLLGSYYEVAGAAGLGELLGSLGDGVLWDARPFYAHVGWELGRADRFWADVGAWERIAFAPLRELVRAVAGLPVVLGGHSLVSGGLLAGVDQAWTRFERGWIVSS